MNIRHKKGNLFMINTNTADRNEDRRIRKTKKLLCDALIRLLSKKSIAEITVTELTEEADVHRGTFYHHYKDAFELKEQVEMEVEQELSELFNGANNAVPRVLLLRVLRYLDEHREISKMLASECGCPRLLHQLCEQLSARCMESNLFGEQLRYGSRFCASGIQGMIATWIEDGMRMPPDDMASVMESMMGISKK